jgi:chemotaxis protein MotB
MPATLQAVTPSPGRTPRRSTSVGRYRRWHVEGRPDTEEEGWLLTYLDVITLILVLVVVMLSQSQPKDREKEKASASQTSQGTTATAAAAPPAPTSDTAGPGPSDSIVPPLPLPVTQTHTAPAGPRTLNGWALDQFGGDIEVIMNDDAVRFRISSEILFAPGTAALTPGPQPALERLIPLLNANPSLRLVVEGHTDSTPIRTERFPSNWELSTGRAASVARFLIENGVAPQRVQATGFADTRPLAARNNPVDRVHNRRVELTMERAPSTPAR